MPLVDGKSMEAFHRNVGTEIRSGRPRNVALAIAYRKKREAEKRGR